jgi:hypothetical protein
MATMVLSPQYRRIQQLANILHDKSVIQTREYYCFYYVFISYFKARHILEVPCLCVCWLRCAESIILSAGDTETIILSAAALRV